MQPLDPANETIAVRQRWDLTAIRLRRVNVALRLSVLTLSIASVVTGVRADATSVWFLIGAVSLALSAFLEKNVLSATSSRRWVRARQIAQALESEVYRYRARVPPYDAGEVAVALLQAREKIVSQFGDGREPADLPEGAAVREVLPQGFSGDAYVDERLDPQLAWFSQRARANQRIADLLNAVGLVLGGGLVVLPVLATRLMAAGSLAPWITVITGLATLLGGQVAQGHFAFLARTYGQSRGQLALLRELYSLGKQDGPAAQKLVTDVERALDQEHASWVANQLTAPGAAPAAAPAGEGAG